MKVIYCSLKNFASYESLEFNFNDQGLCLIEGPTGSGKSTLCDAIPWGLFGRTAKGGTVSEVLSWPGNKVTSADITLDTGETIHRSRGPKPGDNDLMIITEDGDTIRGKDLNDTQKLINNLLGFDAELYLSGAYFHEFSQTAQFFATTSKNRRTICEQIVDLSLAKKLQVSISENLKVLKKELDNKQKQVDTLISNLTLLERLQAAEATKVKDWGKAQELKLIKLQNQAVHFDNMKWATIERLQEECAAELKQNICKSCGSIKVKSTNHISLHKIKYEALIEDEKSKENPYLEYIRSLENEINPHLGSSKDYTNEIEQKSTEYKSLATGLEQSEIKYLDLTLLTDVIGDFRGAVVKNTIIQLENQTNEYLNNHFDAEIRVTFDIKDADKLEVSITKDGNECSYTQLSKGQRQLLKLCFGVSVMKSISNHHGVNFSQIFFDESLDGMDDTIKLKAFSLFQTLELEYNSIFVVEHSSEIKAAFNNKISVSLINGISVIEKA